jgi:hypothetical protein
VAALYRFSACALIINILAAGSLHAQEILISEGAASPERQTLQVPFVFYDESMGFSVGVTLGARGYPQPQATLRSTLVGSSSGSWFLSLGAEHLLVPSTERLFVNSRISFGSFDRIEVYGNGNPDFVDEIAGGNDSDANNFVETEGEDVSASFDLSYLLPFGHGREQTVFPVTLRDGIVVDGGRDISGWNPLKSGVSLATLTPFYRNQNVTSNERGDEKLQTLGAGVTLLYNNTDFSVNPSKGSQQRITVKNDWGGLHNSEEWTTVEFEWSKYISLGTVRSSRQRVLALDFWVIDTPTWDDSDVVAGEERFHRPPSYAGATLGGKKRLRGFLPSRFNSRSAVYYAAEYRHIPEWNPLKHFLPFEWLDVNADWLQLVGFVELGRVAEKFDAGELHSEMKASGGVGVRAFLNQLVTRVDLAVSEEDVQVQMFIDQAF